MPPYTQSAICSAAVKNAYDAVFKAITLNIKFTIAEIVELGPGWGFCTADDFMRMPLEELVEQIAAGSLQVQVGRLFHLDDMVEAQRCMEENKAGGKIVVLT